MVGDTEVGLFAESSTWRVIRFSVEVDHPKYARSGFTRAWDMARRFLWNRDRSPTAEGTQRRYAMPDSGCTIVSR
jgi:hypothetical protein